MKRYHIKAFGITRDILGGREHIVEAEAQTVAALKADLMRRYPDLMNLRSLLVAVNGVYADADHKIHESDEIALIPPVSGG